MARRRLFSDTGFARFACFRDAAAGDSNACPGFPSKMGSSQADRAMDDPNLAVRLGHRRVCVLDALQMVSAGNVMQAIASAIRTDWCNGEPAETGAHIASSASRQNLAHGNDLMFDHTMRVDEPENLW